MQAAAPGLAVEITSAREGDAAGIHVIEARSRNDLLAVRHESFSRRSFAEGAVRGAEWLAGRTGCYNFSDVYGEMLQ
jgi:4-hydroxy-tetrahydrodipicolinate reductase